MKCNNIIIFVFILFLPLFSNAAHIVGGELNYTCLGNGIYEIHLELYRDCFCIDCADFDSPAYITIFDEDLDIQSILELEIDFDSEVLNIELPDSVCQEVTSQICREKSLGYTSTVNLNLLNGEKHIVYQRCCRNNSITNILQPIATGLTLQATIPPDSIAACNSNPNFINEPTFITCIGDTITIDNSAFDIDGDSLSYRLCTSRIGATQAAPYPPVASEPPYGFVSWQSGYDENNPINGDISINSETGLITLFPTQNGVFLISVCVSEFRNGIFLSEKLFDFEIFCYDPDYVPPVGIEDIVMDAPNFQFNYNSGNNMLKLKSNDVKEIANLNLFNLSGQLVYTIENIKSSDSIYLPELNSGLYVVALNLADQKNIETFKLIVSN